MATNILNVVATQSGSTFPLRGDMAVTMNFVPDEHFTVVFVTDDAGTFNITSNTNPFQKFDGTTSPAFTFGGQRNLFVKFMYDKAAALWVATETNAVGAGTGGGSGTPGQAATITVGTVTTGAPGSQAAVTNSGTSTDAVLNFAIPAGQPGTAGSSLPSGGTTGDVLTKSGSSAVWAAPTGGSGGGGSSPEQVITVDGSNNITLSKTVGSNFRITLAADALLLQDPVGYIDGDRINLVVAQDGTGSRKIQRYGTTYEFSGAQAPVLATDPNALNWFEMYQSAGKWLTRVSPDKTVTNGYAPITPIASIGTNLYYSMSDASAASVSGGTIRVIRSGVGAESVAAYGYNNGSITIAGKALGDGTRPILHANYDTRLAWQKGIIEIVDGTALIRDVILSGGRNFDYTSRGVALEDGCTVTMRNVKVYDCENGILTGPINHDLTIEDSEFDFNGQAGINGNGGSQRGATHNIYAGKGSSTFYLRRSTISNSAYGHNVKSRMAHTVLDRVLCTFSHEGRELDLPEGGILEVTDCIFYKPAEAVQNDLIRIAGEGVDTSRPRQYTFRNCRFESYRAIGTDSTFMWNNDTGTDCVFIDCEFIGDGPKANNTTVDGLTTVAGMRGRCVIQTTPGVTPGPRYTVGYTPQTIPA